MLSVAAFQVPFPLLVSVRVTVPAVFSAAVGAYVAFKVFAFGVNVPAPPDHVPPEATVTEPASVTVALLEHTVWSAPALAVGAVVIVITITSFTPVHPPLFVEVSVSVLVPAVISAALGVYVVLSALAFPKVPVPEEVHVPLPVEEEPERVTTELFAHTV